MLVLLSSRRARRLLSVIFASSIAIGLLHAPSMVMAANAPAKTVPAAAHHKAQHHVAQQHMSQYMAAHDPAGYGSNDPARQGSGTPSAPENCPLVSVTAAVPPAPAQARPIVTAQLSPRHQSPLVSADLGTLDPPPRGLS